MLIPVHLALRIEGGNSGFLPLFIGGVILVIAFAIFGYIQEKKRREALEAIARQLGFSFSTDKDHSFASQYGFLNHMSSGSNRYAFNIMQGTAGD